jgi:hypothetical protein
MTIKYGLQFLFFELTDNDGQNFVAGIVHTVHTRVQNNSIFLKLIGKQLNISEFNR